MLSLDIPLQKLFGCFKRLQLWATGDWQFHHDNVPAHASRLMQFFCETSNHPGDSAPTTAEIWHPATSGFSKTKIAFERDEISEGPWDQENTMKQLMATGKTVRSQGAYFEGNRDVIVPCTIFLVSCIFFNKYKCLFFIWHGWILSGQTIQNQFHRLHCFTAIVFKILKIK